MILRLTDVDPFEIVQPVYHLAQWCSGVPFGIQTNVSGLLVAEIHIYMVVICKLAKYLLQFGIHKGADAVGFRELRVES